jgi:hypothetical protein
LHRALEPIVSRLRGHAVDLLLDGSLSAVWFTWFVGSILQSRHAACSATGGPSGPILSGVLEHFGFTCPNIERIDTPPAVHERERYRSLADRLGCPLAASVPWSLPDRARSLARDWLERHGLAEGRYVACFPGSSGHAKIRRWQDANFVNVLDRLDGERNLPAVLIGNAAEQLDLERIARMASKSTAVLGGHPDDLALVAGLVGLARAFLGNDSGPAHLAQAFGIPGVVLFGGGGRPASYACWGAGAIGVLHPLPCFGCAWDCFVGRGLCVESIPVAVVADAMNQILDNPASEPKTIAVDTLKQPMNEVLAAATRYNRVMQSDRDRRIALMVDMDARMIMLEHTAEERLAVLERIHAEAERYRGEMEARLSMLERVAAERLAVIESVHAEAERSHGEMEARLSMLERVAAERLAVIESVHAEAERRGKVIEKLTGRPEGTGTARDGALRFGRRFIVRGDDRSDT